MQVSDLIERAHRAPRTLVFADGEDERVQRAALEYTDSGMGEAVLLERDTSADPRLAEFAATLASARADKGLTPPQAVELLADPLYFGGMLVRTAGADGMVAGAGRPTAEVIRAAIHTVGLAPGASRASSFFLMLPPGGTPLTFADCGVIVRPSAEELAGIAVAAAGSHRALTGDAPRVAFLSFSTHGSAEHPELDTVRRAVALARDSAADHSMDPADFDGELQVDAALDADVARRKAPGSAVAGRANVLVFPDLASGNIGYKLVQRLGGAQAFGPILQGLARPVNDLSRGATVGEIVAVAAVTSLQAGWV